MNRRLILIVALLISCVTLAKAHAFLDSAEPAVGSTIRQSPSVVKIWFTRELKTEGSDIKVFNTSGTEIDLKTVSLDPKNRFLMTVPVAKLATGIYKVTWNAICLGDGHHTSGSFTFEVKI